MPQATIFGAPQVGQSTIPAGTAMKPHISSQQINLSARLTKSGRNRMVYIVGGLYISLPSQSQKIRNTPKILSPRAAPHTREVLRNRKNETRPADSFSTARCLPELPFSKSKCGRRPDWTHSFSIPASRGGVLCV